MQLKIKNYQAIENAELEFPVGITMICGSTNSGKTAILRSMYNALCNPTSAKSDINHKSEDGICEVQIIDDEADIKWIRSKNSVSYIVNGESYFKCGKSNIWSILPEYSLKCEKENSIYNFHTEYDSLFPFRYSSSEVFNIFERVIALDDTTSISKAINSDITSLSLLRKQVKKSIQDIEREKEEKEVCLTVLLKTVDDFLSSNTFNEGNSIQVNELNKINEIKLNQCNEIKYNQGNEINSSKCNENLNQLIKEKINQFNLLLLKEINNLRELKNKINILKENRDKIKEFSLKLDKFNTAFRAYNKKELLSKIDIFISLVSKEVSEFTLLKSNQFEVKVLGKRISILSDVYLPENIIIFDYLNNEIPVYSRYLSCKESIVLFSVRESTLKDLSNVRHENFDFKRMPELVSLCTHRRSIKSFKGIQITFPDISEYRKVISFDKTTYDSYIKNKSSIKGIYNELSVLKDKTCLLNDEKEKILLVLSEYKHCPLCGKPQ